MFVVKDSHRHGNVCVFPCCYVLKDFRSEDAEDGCGLSNGLECNQKIVNAITEHKSCDELLTAHPPIRQHAQLNSQQNRCIRGSHHYTYKCEGDRSIPSLKKRFLGQSFEDNVLEVKQLSCLFLHISSHLISILYLFFHCRLPIFPILICLLVLALDSLQQC